MAYYDDNGDEYKSVSEPIFPISRIGTTMLIDQSNPDPLQALRGEIFAGAGNIEICAPGTGRSNAGNKTFQGIEEDQLQAIREMAKVNDVNITTHSSFQIGNLAGLGERGYSESQRRMSVDEIKKAIDFAAQAANGGSVVVHTGEFPRALVNNKTINQGDTKFKLHKKEHDEAIYYLANEHTGEIIQGVRPDAVIFEPVIETDKNGKEILIRDANGNPVVDDVIQESILSDERITSKYGTDWSKIPENIKQDAYVKKFSHDKGNIKTQKVTFADFQKRKLAELTKKGMSEAEAQGQIVRDFYKTQVYSQVRQALGQAREYEQLYTGGLDEREKTLQEINRLKKIKESLSEEGWKEFIQTYTPKEPVLRRSGTMYEPGQDPFKFYDDKLDDNQRSILHGRETATSGRTQAKEFLRKINVATSIENFALKKSAETIAELGVYAYDQTKKMLAERPNDKVKPIAITLENIFPESYGAHPDEIINLVEIGRKKLKEELMEQRQLSEKDAKKQAEEHIKITLDSGHLNIWRKYIEPKPGESKEDTDKRFKEWQVKELQKLVDKGIIGNVHIADNLGYDDDHITPGRGTAPIKELLEMLKKKGYKDVLTNEGGFGRGKSGQAGLRNVWKLAGSSIYNSGRAGTDAWLNPSSRFGAVHDSYLGAGNKPNFIFKGYSPDSEDWTPWSGSRME